MIAFVLEPLVHCIAVHCAFVIFAIAIELDCSYSVLSYVLSDPDTLSLLDLISLALPFQILSTSTLK